MDNPYEFNMSTAPDDFSQIHAGLPAREAAAMMIRAWLDGQCSELDVSTGLESLLESKHDPAIAIAYETFWCGESDQRLSPGSLTKPIWDYWQRILLLLDSDCRIVEEKTVWRSWTQAVAAVTLIGFLFVVARFGWGLHLFAFAMPFGVISIILSRLRSKLIPEPLVMEQIIEPFRTIADLEYAYRNRKTFEKQKYRGWIADRQLRARSTEWPDISIWPAFIIWMMFAPLPLAFQMFPVSQTQTRAVAA
jgi:hypothetical protein